MRGRTTLKTYVVTTGVMFSLMVVVHVWRATIEGIGLVKEPTFLIFTGASVAMALWAWRVFKALPKSQ